MTNSMRSIKARVGLPCEVRFHNSWLKPVGGITVELSRDWMIVTAFPLFPFARLKGVTHVSVSIQLPHAGFQPHHILECSGMICELRLVESGMRVHTAINSISIQDRDHEQRHCAVQ